MDEQLAAGIAPIDVPDAFYLQRRMGTWAGATHGAVEYVRDTTSRLWSGRLLPVSWAWRPRERVESLLSSEPAALDTMSRYFAWRLATPLRE